MESFMESWTRVLLIDIFGFNLQMGYASPAPKNAGVHTRLYSRAFVIDDEINRVVFVSVDCGMLDQIVKTEVWKRNLTGLRDGKEMTWSVF